MKILQSPVVLNRIISNLPRFNPLYVPVILTPIVLLSPVLFLGKAIFWGTPFLQFIPWRWAAWEMLRSGRLPLWNPEVGMGAPLAANYQSALFYPPNWISFFLAAWGGLGWLAWGQALLVALHLILAGLGMSLLARQLGLNRLAQVVSGLAFGLSGYLVSRSGFLSINAATAWVPWVILLITRLESRKVKGFSLAVILALQLLAGHAQTCWYTLLLAGMWTTFLGWKRASCEIRGAKYSPVGARGFAQPQHWRNLCLYLRRITVSWAMLGLSFALALALAALQLLPTLEYLQQSQRAASVGYDFAMTYSFWPWRFLTLLAPDLFGNPAHGDFWGYGNYWEDALYIGMLPVLMAVGVVLRMLGRKTAGRWLQSASRDAQVVESEWVSAPSCRPVEEDRGAASLVPFLAALILLSFALALGKNTGFFPWLYRHFPTFDMFQAPTRFSLWAEFGLALLAGIGVNAWRRPAGRGLYWTRLGTAGAFAVTLGTGLAFLLLGDISPTFLRATALSGMWAMGVGVLSLLAPPGGGSVSQRSAVESQMKSSRYSLDLWIWVVVLFVCADLLLANSGMNPGTSLSLYTQFSRNAAAVRSVAGEGRIYIPSKDEYGLKFDRFFSFKSFDAGEGWADLREVLLPDAHSLDGLASVNNFDPLVPGRYTTWMEALESAGPQSLPQLLNLMNVGVVVKVDPTRETGVWLDAIEAGSRLRWVSCAYPSSSPQDSLAKVTSGDFDPKGEVILEGLADGQGLDCSLEGSSKGDSNARVQFISTDPDRLVVHMMAGAEGWLVLSDVWYPGWRATVDGTAAPVLRANYLFRAVAVPAGEHEVVFAYRPVSFSVGALISLAGWAGLAGFWMWRVRFREPANQPRRLLDLENR